MLKPDSTPHWHVSHVDRQSLKIVQGVYLILISKFFNLKNFQLQNLSLPYDFPSKIVKS